MKKYMLIPLLIVVGFGVWLFYWPLMESFYAWSMDPLIAKFESFILGIILMFGGSYYGVKVL